MDNLPLPDLLFRETYEACVSSVGDEGLRGHMENVCDDLEVLAEHYNARAEIAELYTFRPLITRRNENPEVLPDITKKDLMKLYTQHMVSSDSGRLLYDRIKVEANDKCPFCGGIGQVTTLDHYLPKANYPQFSVHPSNLVPACRDCNTEKRNDLASIAEEQVLHPYFEPNHFYEETWIKARLERSEELFVSYFVEAPPAWSATDVARVNKHFLDFDLADRYRVRAGQELSTVVHVRSDMFAGAPEKFREYLLSVHNSFQKKNFWQPVMYKALAEDQDFCEGE